jgi:UDP-N-acetylmuramoyl-tripeptide--D-alanyl-D-alanine ligase
MNTDRSRSRGLSAGAGADEVSKPLEELAELLDRRGLLADVLPDRSSAARVPIGRVVYDSRRVAPGCVFVAIRGARADGHDFIPPAVASGASAVAASASWACGSRRASQN